MKKLLSLIFLSIFLITNPVFSQDNSDQKKTEELVEIINSKENPAIIYFYSKWCFYCRKTTPTLKNVEKNLSDKFNFVYIDTEQPYSIPFSGHFKVGTVPTAIINDTKNNKRQRINDIYSASQKDIEDLLTKYYAKNYSK